MKSLSKKEKGFTLIEIVIVLAIAAAIMLMVFLAVQGARKSQRDTQRRTDASRMAALLDQYAANNSGAYPTTAEATMGSVAGDFWNAYVVPANITVPGGTTAYTPGALVTTASTLTTAQLNALATNTAEIAVNNNAYQVCIGAEAVKYVCAQSK
jgi:prepilin-type N-terminal cleavage/methylation domain-containing protein